MTVLAGSSVDDEFVTETSRVVQGEMKAVGIFAQFRRIGLMKLILHEYLGNCVHASFEFSASLDTRNFMCCASGSKGYL